VKPTHRKKALRKSKELKSKGLISKTKKSPTVAGVKSSTRRNAQGKKSATRPMAGKLQVSNKRRGTLQQAVQPPKSLLVVERPTAARAIRAFEHAIKIFNRHDFERARHAFETLIERFPDEPDVLARARAYLAICRHRLDQSPAPPRTVEALYDRGVIELNRGQIGQAILLFERALRLDPAADHIVYALASAYAKGGDADRALDALRQCIRKNETYRIQARRDPDFRSLYTNEDFQNLVGLEVVE
jgi:tetratricopeptide (TPR) repeat protein